MSGILQNVGGIVGAGMKGLIDMAEGYMHPHDMEDGDEGDETTIQRGQMDSNSVAPASAVGIAPATASPVSAPSSSASATSSAFSQMSIAQTKLVELVDVPSGWIHLQSTYLDGNGGERKIRTFGLKNVGTETVQVEIGSDLGGQIVFWKGDDEKDMSSAASYSSSSSASNTSGTTTFTSMIHPSSTSTFYLAFTPSHITSPTNATSPTSEGGFTPRLLPALSRQKSDDISTVPIIPGLPSASSTSDSVSVGSSQSVAGSFKGATNTRRQEPVHRSFSVHGSIVIHASTHSGPNMSLQHVNLPFFATVCKSLFTAALIDPVSGLASGSQQSSGQMIIDFGSDSIVGKEYHRDILLVNRSEIELVWITAVVNARYKDAAWFSLRDLDSENVFGVDTSSQPVPLPALSSRHLRLELRVKEPVPDFSFDFVISNIHQSGNLVTCRAIGSGQPETTDTSLKILSGTSLDFGQITDGVWAKKLITCKNVGEKALDIKLSGSLGVDVVFRLAGVAGDDMDEDIPMEKLLPSGVGGGGGKKVVEHTLSRQSTRERSRGRAVVQSDGSRPASPTSSNGRATSAYEAGQHHHKLLGMGDNISTDGESYASSSARGTSVSAHHRDASVTPSHPLSRVASHTSSYRFHTDATESEDEEVEAPFFTNGESLSITPQPHPPPKPPSDTSQSIECITDQAIPNQIEELAMRPGTEYRIFVLYRPARDTVNPPEIAGGLRPTKFKIYIDSTPSSRSSSSSNTVPVTRHTLHCQAESCTSLISIASGSKIDFGEVTVGASKSTTLRIRNMSQLLAKVEIAAISKVLSTNRNVIVIPPGEEVEEKMEFFPRRINERYEKQVFVRNLLNRANVEIRSKNVDINNVTLHSHLYRILTPNGANFLDFGSVIINSPTVRTLLFENLTFAPLVLSLMASQPEDIELYVKLEDCDGSALDKSLVFKQKHADSSALERVTSPQNGNGDLKERFMETLRELGTRPVVPAPKVKVKGLKGKEVEKGSNAAVEKGSDSVAGGSAPAPKLSIGAAVAAALKKGGRGRPVLLYGNAVMFKDRSLLDEHEHLDLAAGPPISAHRTSPRSKISALLDTIELEDKAKLSGQRIPKLDFAASAKATGLVSKDHKVKKKSSSNHPNLPSSSSPKAPSTSSTMASSPKTPTAPTHTAGIMPSFTSIVGPSLTPGSAGPSTPDGGKSPALTGKRAEPRTEMFQAGDISKMSVDNLLVSMEQHDARRSTAGSSWTLEEEEVFVKQTISLRKELANLISTGRLIPARALHIPPSSSKQLIVIMTPNGSIRPHISTRPKRADSRLFIRLNEFDRGYLSDANAEVLQSDLPVRDLIMRSNCVRSVLEVQQTSINMGNCDKGEVKSKTIVIQNKSDSIGLFRLRTSGSIASGDLKLGLGRYGVISAFGRKEVENFSFTPSLVGNYQENIVIENVLDSYQEQNVAVKANVRKQPNFIVEPAALDFGVIDHSTNTTAIKSLEFIITNTSKSERVFAIEVFPSGDSAFAEVSISRDESDAGTALSKEQEEEAEGMLQKLKIARRKGKEDKIVKYETRLTELGVSFPPAAAAASLPAGGESETESTEDKDKGGKADDEVKAEIEETKEDSSEDSKSTPSASTPQACVTTLSITLSASQKTKISVQLLRRIGMVDSQISAQMQAKIHVFEKKNTDETVTVGVSASIGSGDVEKASVEKARSEAGIDNTSTSDSLHLALMRHCLLLTLQCPVSPTAFCVGSTLFLPSSSTLYTALQSHFPSFPSKGTSAGLILADGYSRQIPGNTHAEANALANFRTRYAELIAEKSNSLPDLEDVLKEVDCHATMEPCSIRTSGGPSCALELVRSKVRTVYLGVEEPADFVQCEGVQILQDGGVKVRRTVGLEEDCLKAARRGRT